MAAFSEVREIFSSSNSTGPGLTAKDNMLEVTTLSSTRDPEPNP
jgi:hypothetical protein